jgi:hypothetical protein
MSPLAADCSDDSLGAVTQTTSDGDGGHNGREYQSLSMALTAIQNVFELTVQPCFTGRVIMPALNGFIEHVRIVAAKPGHFLLEPASGLSHQILVTSIP